MTTKGQVTRKNILSVAIATGVAAGVMAPAHPAAAAPTCFGRKATIVGTNRDKSRTVELKGTLGNDVIVGLKGIDYISGRGGDDLICAGGGYDYIDGGPGNDKIRGGDGIDVITGRGGNDRIWAGRGPLEELYGGGGNDRLFGGPGSDDWLLGGPGDDVLDGGSGSRDVVLFGDSPQGVHADLSTGEATGHGNDRMVSVETVAGTYFDDVLYGDDNANLLAGGSGDDELHGLGGDDHLRSGDPAPAGNDLLDGGEGSDTANYYLSWEGVEADLSTGQAVSSGVDTLVGIENLFGSKEDDVLIGNDESNVIQGFQGDDVMDGRGGTDMAMFQNSFELLIDLREGTAVEERGSDTLENFEDIVGSAFADTIIGDDGPNSIWGGSGADTLVGAAGDDTLMGERGTDSANGGTGTDNCDAETEIDCELGPAAAIYSGEKREFDAVPPRPTMVGDGRHGMPSADARNVEEPLRSLADCQPARARLAFVRDLGGSVGNEIFTVRPDGRGLKRLTANEVDEWSPAWSPDGTTIAFSSTRDGNSEIYVMDRAGEEVTRLTENETSDAVPAWSPDGTKIAFSSARDDPEGTFFDMYVMDADGANVTKVIGGPGSEQNASWSASGRRIAFDRDDSIFTVRSDGTDLKKLTSRRRLLATSPSWSHDGRRILFQAQRTEVRGMDIFVMKSDGTDKELLIGARGEQQTPSWSPNDRRIAFSGNWRVARSRADGSGIVTLFDHDLADYTVDWGRAARC